MNANYSTGRSVWKFSTRRRYKRSTIRAAKKEAGEQINAQLDAAMTGFNNRRDDANARELSDAIAKATLETQTLNEQRDTLAQNAGKPESVIARELELVGFRLSEIDRLKRAGGRSEDEIKQLADESVARKRLAGALADQVSLTQKLNQARREGRQERTDLDKDESLAAQGLSRGDIERERARRGAVRSAEPDIKAAIENGTMTQAQGDVELWNVGEDAVSAFDKRGRNSKNDDQRDLEAQSRAQIAMLRAQAELVRNSSLESGGPDSPEMARATKLLEKKRELEEFNRTAATADKVDVVDRLNLYNDELDAEEELRRASETRGNAVAAVTQELEMQRDIALALARTEAERLDIQDRFDAKIRENKGVTMSPEEEGARGRTRAGREELTRINQLKSQAEELQGVIFDGMNKGSEEGVGAMLRNFARGSAEMMKKALLMRAANYLTQRTTGVDLRDGEPDALDRIKGWGAPNLLRGKHVGAGANLNLGSIMAGVIGIAPRPARGDQEAPAAAQAPARSGIGGVLGSIFGIGGKGKDAGQRIQNATIHIENARETIERATIYTTGGGESGGSSSGSVATGDQRWDAVLSLLT